MAAAQKLLIDSFVATAAVAGRQLCGKNEAMMFLPSLVFRRLMAIQTREAPARVGAQFKLVDYGIVQLGMALGAFPRGSREGRSLAAGIRYGTLAVHKKRAHDQRESDHKRDKHGAKWHHL